MTLQEIINLINEDDVKDLTKKLVNIPSTYSDGEYEICQFLYEELNLSKQDHINRTLYEVHCS